MQDSTFSEKANALMEMVRNDDSRLNCFGGRDYSKILVRTEQKRDDFRLQPKPKKFEGLAEKTLKALQECETQELAAKKLGISKSQLYNRMMRYNIIKKKI